MTVTVEPCTRGHTDWYYPPDGSKRSRYCRSCKRDKHPPRRRLCTHDGPCEQATNVRGSAYCRTQARHCQREARQLGKARLSRRERETQSRMVHPPDGLEYLYGPVPRRVPDRIWVDRVVLELTLRGERVGRRLTRGEKRALELLSALHHPNGG